MILRPWVLLLAAGGSRRYGRPKLLARIGGESLLRRSARVVLGCRAAGYTIVLGAGAVRLKRELRGLPLEVVVNRRWRQGLSSSLRAGIATIPPQARGALVLLADQIAIGPADLALLVAAWRREPRALVAACADGVLGPPAILPRAAFPAVRRLRGDVGARTLFADPARKVIGIGMASAAYDIDTPADLVRWQSAPVVS